MKGQIMASPPHPPIAAAAGRSAPESRRPDPSWPWGRAFASASARVSWPCGSARGWGTVPPFPIDDGQGQAADGSVGVPQSERGDVGEALDRTKRAKVRGEGLALLAFPGSRVGGDAAQGHRDESHANQPAQGMMNAETHEDVVVDVEDVGVSGTSR